MFCGKISAWLHLVSTCMIKTPLLRGVDKGFVDIRKAAFTFCFQHQLVKIICCSIYCFIFLGFFTCFIHTKFTTPSKQHTKVGLEKGTEIAAEPIVVLVSRDADKSFCVYIVILYSLCQQPCSLHSKKCLAWLLWHQC